MIQGQDRREWGGGSVEKIGSGEGGLLTRSGFDRHGGKKDKDEDMGVGALRCATPLERTPILVGRTYTGSPAVFDLHDV